MAMAMDSPIKCQSYHLSSCRSDPIFPPPPHKSKTWLFFCRNRQEAFLTTNSEIRKGCDAHFICCGMCGATTHELKTDTPTSSISTGFVKMPNFFSRPSLERMSLRKIRSSRNVSSSCSISFLCSLSVSLRGSGGGALAKGSKTRRAENTNQSYTRIHSWLADELDCNSQGRGSTPRCDRVNRVCKGSEPILERLSVISAYLALSPTDTACTEDPMSTFQQEKVVEGSW